MNQSNKNSDAMTAGEARAWPASYQETFDAIAAATKIQAGMISVSVRDFYRALSYPDKPSTPTPSSPGVPDSVRAPDELTREQIRGRALALLLAKGWVPGDTFFAPNVAELMTTFGMSLLVDLPQDRCAHLECGCDAAIATHPAGQSTGQGAEAEQRITNLANALASAQRQRGEQEQRAIAAEQRIIDLEQGKIHPALAVDVQEHRNQAYQGGWDDGYAEGHGKATADASKPAPDSTRTGQVGTEEGTADCPDCDGIGVQRPHVKKAQPTPGIDEEAVELFQSERISAALAAYDFVLGDIETNYEDREERVFDAMKAAIQRADYIARMGNFTK